MKPKKLFMPLFQCPTCRSKTGHWKREARWEVDGHKLWVMGNTGRFSWSILLAMLSGEEGLLPKCAVTVLVCQECNQWIREGE